MSNTIRIDSAWIAANPVPVHDAAGTTKNSRGRVLVIGGSRMVPGALRLTGEAVLRAGAGKLQMATIASATMGLGLFVPEAGVIALTEDQNGEIVGDAHVPLDQAIDSCETLILGPGIGTTRSAAALIRIVRDRPRDDLTLVIDALALGGARDMKPGLTSFAGRLVFTPHHGEMAMLTGRDESVIGDDPERAARDVADAYGAVVVLKGSDTVSLRLMGRCSIMAAAAPAWPPPDRGTCWQGRSAACCRAGRRRWSPPVGASGCMGKVAAGWLPRQVRSVSWLANYRRNFLACYRNDPIAVPSVARLPARSVVHLHPRPIPTQSEGGTECIIHL